ncbi:thioredoxin domain-containing protein [Sphingomonas sp.]|uniref:DsbA family protein n=1 Tax=Sphingomonas sp. TaxID=28214 RepID=UPI0025DEDA4A|nr:thioredoxin domain-containing protein [Sphingomonas sp.]MBV9528235.1 thioredoxin domain-containing protein [Sphingomonas sp.]
MTIRVFLASAAAVLALAGCNKGGNQNLDVAAGNDTSTVTVTQANPPPGGTWADVVNATSDGYMMGNPNAKVKLVEIGSLSCPHCRLFEQEGSPILVDKYVKTGQVSWEFRPYVIHGAIDVAANLIARCNGVKTFFPMSKAMYADQPTWMGKYEAAPQDKVQQIQNLPTNQIFVQMASLMGLQDWAAARGLPQAKSNQCLSDQKMIEHEVQASANVNNDYPDFQGTPAFVINGTMAKDVAGWDKLLPLIQAAVK